MPNRSYRPGETHRWQLRKTSRGFPRYFKRDLPTLDHVQKDRYVQTYVRGSFSPAANIFSKIPVCAW